MSSDPCLIPTISAGVSNARHAARMERAARRLLRAAERRRSQGKLPLRALLAQSCSCSCSCSAAADGHHLAGHRAQAFCAGGDIKACALAVQNGNTEGPLECVLKHDDAVRTLAGIYSTALHANCPRAPHAASSGRSTRWSTSWRC